MTSAFKPHPEYLRLTDLHAFYGEESGVRIARKHLGWYAKDRPENAAFRSVVNRAETADEQLRLAAEYFEALEADAVERSARQSGHPPYAAVPAGLFQANRRDTHERVESGRWQSAEGQKERGD